MTTPYRYVALDTVVSTNDEAMSRLRDGEPGGFVVTARVQTGGRGRHARSWVSPAGNLYMTVALRDPAPPACAPQLGFVAGVALAGTLRASVDGNRSLELKWPNDVLFAGAKLAGMLLESTTLAGGKLGCVIGIGVNCRSHPNGLAYASTDLSTIGACDPDPDVILADFIDRFDIQLRLWDSGNGFPAVRSAWLAMAAGIGQRIVAITPRGRLEGFFRDLDATGRLLLDTAAGRQAVEAGDIFFPALAAANTH